TARTTPTPTARPATRDDRRPSWPAVVCVVEDYRVVGRSEPAMLARPPPTRISAMPSGTVGSPPVKGSAVGSAAAAARKRGAVTVTTEPRAATGPMTATVPSPPVKPLLVFGGL